MGIIGLKKYLSSDQNSDLAVKEWIPYGSRLNVDAFGWLFHLMNSPEGLSILRQYGGSYIDFDALIRKAYFEIISLGLTLSLYFDGRNTQMKMNTHKERDSKRAESWMAIYYASKSDNARLHQSTLDLPALTKQQFIYTMTSLGASLIYCDHEADQQIALSCKEANETSVRSCFCYGDDT